MDATRVAIALLAGFILASPVPTRALFFNYIDQVDDALPEPALAAASGMALSQDGTHLYAASAHEDAVSLFLRDPITGTLTYDSAVVDGAGAATGLLGASAVVLSPADDFAYVAGAYGDSIAVFSRNGTSGVLTYASSVADGIGGVDGLDRVVALAISPDGAHLYAAGERDDAIAIFSRDGGSGALTFIAVVRDGVLGVDGIDGLTALAVSPEGAHVYAIGTDEDAVAAFSRNSVSGLLTPVATYRDGSGSFDGLEGGNSIVISDDGDFVYVAGGDEAAVAVLGRDPGSGTLSFVEVQRNGVGGVTGLGGVRAIALSPDARNARLYGVSFDDDAIFAFGRNADDGTLEFIEAGSDGASGISGIYGVLSLAVSPNGRHAYTASTFDQAVAIFGTVGTVGDCVIDAGEECDDCNADAGDGCSDIGDKEDGWNCTDEPTLCTEICGDALVVGDETCDDSNTSNGDCCSSSCTLDELGTSCADADLCNGAETCDGNGVCQAAPPASSGTPCPDADLCDGTETCDGAGSCQAGTPVSCDDGAVCNGAESCNPATGACDPGTPAPADTACEDDGNPCTVSACDGSGACQANPGNAGVECRARAGQCDVAEVCSGSSPTCPPDGFVAADTDCSDGSDLTCPDKCDGAGTCVPGNDESTECRNTCCDGVDNDGDESTDIEDGGCGLGQESRTAVVTTSPKRNAIKMGGTVNIASLDLEVNRPDCDEPYTYRTEAGICGEHMSLRKDGEVGFVATLATEALSGSQAVVFGKGFDIRSHWVSDGLPVESQEPPPLVGMGTCSLGGESCTQPLTPLLLGESCPSASAGACCPNPSAVCEGRLDLFDPNNPAVITDGSHPDYARCQALRTELADSSDAVAALVPNHPVYNDTDEPERIRVLPSLIPANCDSIEDADACTAACAQYCTVTLGAGQQVLYVDSIDVKRDMPLRLCRDFNLTVNDPPTVAIVRIADSFKLSPGARIEACGVPPDRILWNAEGEKGSVKFARGADLIGSVLAPRRKSIKFGGDATLRGSLFAPIVTFSKFTEMYHYPFSAGLE